MRQITLHCIRVILILILLGTSIAKFVSGYEPEFIISKSVYYTVAILEILIALILNTRLRSIGGVMAAVLFSSGAVLGVLTNRPCGCFGGLSIFNSKKVHVLFAGSAGVLASVFVILHLKKPAPVQ